MVIAVFVCRYFQQLVAEFELRMVLCRQQIEEMESHLATLHQSVMLTPQGTHT